MYLTLLLYAVGFARNSAHEVTQPVIEVQVGELGPRRRHRWTLDENEAQFRGAERGVLVRKLQRSVDLAPDPGRLFRRLGPKQQEQVTVFDFSIQFPRPAV